MTALHWTSKLENSIKYFHSHIRIALKVTQLCPICLEVLFISNLKVSIDCIFQCFQDLAKSFFLLKWTKSALYCAIQMHASLKGFLAFWKIIYLLLAVLDLHCSACFSSCGYQGLLLTGSRGTDFSSCGIWTWLVYDMWNFPGPGIEPVPCTARQILTCYTTREVLKVSFFS